MTPRWDLVQGDLAKYAAVRDMLVRATGPGVIHSLDESVTSWRAAMRAGGLDPYDPDVLYTTALGLGIVANSLKALLKGYGLPPQLLIAVEGGLNNIGVVLAELMPAEARPR